jgi:hypothetical protein
VWCVTGDAKAQCTCVHCTDNSDAANFGASVVGQMACLLARTACLCRVLSNLCLQAFSLYEERVPDQRSRVTALQSIMATLHACYVFGPDNRERLVANAAGWVVLQALGRAQLHRKSETTGQPLSRN